MSRRAGERDDSDRTSGNNRLNQCGFAASRRDPVPSRGDSTLPSRAWVEGLDGPAQQPGRFFGPARDDHTPPPFRPRAGTPLPDRAAAALAPDPWPSSGRLLQHPPDRRNERILQGPTAQEPYSRLRHTPEMYAAPHPDRATGPV